MGGKISNDIDHHRQDENQINDILKKKTANPVHPTPLYISFFSLNIDDICYDYREYSCWSTYPVLIGVGMYLLWIIIVMIVGVLIVVFTTPNNKSNRIR